MSIPSGAKVISNITYNNLYFLTDVNTASATMDSSDFDMSTGKPIKNTNYIY